VRNQTTIAREVLVEGIGLHTGQQAELRFCQSDADTGMRFVSEGEESGEPLTASPLAVISTNRGTSLRGANGMEVHTVEHLMAACFGLGIDNVLFRLRGPEVPAGDGSCLAFLKALSQAGRVSLARPRKSVALSCPVWVADSDACLVALPAAAMEVTFAVAYPFIGSQLASFVPEPGSFASDIAPARTFGFEHEAGQILAAGLAQGASKDNVLLIGEKGYSSPPRFADEVVRHKILDLLGDLALIGLDLECRIVAIRSGHRLNNQLARAVLSQIETGGCDVHA
jgi:UDP-3-O-[3-hydroxymyristoyl] N-acetylglucosamine deacetylase